jgi:peptidoglycan/xylan/chitin deacetylase (PgdA/CDA1 family)
MTKNVLAMALGSIALAAWGCHGTDEPSQSSEDQLVSVDQLDGSDLPPGKYVLTFDDGPAERTEELANWLGDRGIVATFFINGVRVPGLESALKTVKARGHILGNHTQNHVDMRAQFGQDLIDAVGDTDSIIARFQPDGPWLLRAPFGAWNGRVAGDVNGSAMQKYVGPVFWNAGGELTDTTAADWACWSNGVTVEACANLYLNEMKMRGRGIVLMHDLHSQSVDMAKIIVEAMGAGSFVPLTSAPQIAARLAGGGLGGGGAGATCSSATLGTGVPKGTCVQRNDGAHAWFRCDGADEQDWTPIGGPGEGCTSCPQLGGSCSGGTCDSATLGTNVPSGTCVQRADRQEAWFVCGGRDLQDWRDVAGADDPACTACPQLGGACPPHGQDCDSATLEKAVAPGTCVQRADAQHAWFLCGGAGSQDWNVVSGPKDPACRSCPQVGTCR